MSTVFARNADIFALYVCAIYLSNFHNTKIDGWVHEHRVLATVNYLRMAFRKPVFLFHNSETMLKHIPPGTFPEKPIRLSAVSNALQTGGLWNLCSTQLTTPIPRSVIAKIYGMKEVMRWEALSEKASMSGIVEDTNSGDIFWSEGTLDAVYTAANASVMATHTVLNASEVSNAFCIVRPPGHHCFQNPAGFCFVNNVALAAYTATSMGKRVAILDWDYHFGDGTAQTFLNDTDVMFCSLHCARDRNRNLTYPQNKYKGDLLSQETDGRMFNIQWAKDDADNAAYAYAFDKVVMPALKRFAPDIILVSAGYDALKGDALAGMELTPSIFYELTSALGSLGLPVVCIMEGGYDPDLLAAGVSETVRGLLTGCTNELDILGVGVQEHHKRVVDTVAEQLLLVKKDSCM